MISKVKEYRLKNGKRLGDFLEQKYPQYKTEWSHTGNVIAFLVHVPGLRSPNIFRWEIEDNKIYATNGSSISVTPELDKRKQDLDTRKQAISVELMRIYNFVKQYHLEEGQPIEIVLDKANKEFGLPQGDIEEIFIKVDKLLYSK